MKMKHLFLLLSFLMLLSSNIAMAADYDCFAPQQDLSNLIQDHSFDPSNENNNNGDDSCHSHIASHFVGIYPDMVNSYMASSSLYLPIPLSIPSSQSIQPATPPPNYV